MRTSVSTLPLDEAADGLSLLYPNILVLKKAVKGIDQVGLRNRRTVLTEFRSPIVDSAFVESVSRPIDREYLRSFRGVEEVRHLLVRIEDNGKQDLVFLDETIDSFPVG